MAQTEKKLPKVLVVCTNADLAGAPIHVRGLVNGLRDQFDFTVVFGESGPVADTLRESGIPVYLIESLRSEIQPLQDLKTLWRLLVLVRRIQPDLLHLHSAKAGIVGRLVGFLTRTPWIYSIHGWPWRGFGSLKTRVIILIEKILRLIPGRYIYVAQDVALGAAQVLSIPAERGMVIYNGVADSVVQPEQSGALKIFMAARVSSAKDHETLVKGFERLDFSSELVLCGHGTDEDDFFEKVRSWAPQRFSQIKLLGARNDVRELMHQTNVFALISNFEALPLSILEAMAAQRAVIATDVGGVSEVLVESRNGILVRRSSVEDVAFALQRLRDDQVRLNMAACARHDYEKYFSERTMLCGVDKLYRNAISDNGCV